ncbi:MAG: DUF6701 domain-containing protein [Syntrophotaleaceae bacterium]
MTARLRVILYCGGLLVFLLTTSQAHAVCSDYVGDVVINEIYDGQGPGPAFVETRLLDNGLVLALAGGWTTRICRHQGNRDVCVNYSFGGGEWWEALWGNPYFMFFPSEQAMDINGMDITIRDSANGVIDYLSINGYDYQRSECSAVANNRVDLGPGIKGAQRLPDGTGDWSPFQKPGATDEITPNRSNAGTMAQIDHFRIFHPADALTCQRASISVQACADENCSNSSEIETTVSLSASSGAWVGGTNSVTFAGSSPELYLRRNTPGEAVVSIASATVVAANPTRCYADTALSDCSIAFHDSGFIFQVSPLTSCANSTGVTIQAVRKDDHSEACIGHGSFANQEDKPVLLSTSYLVPTNSSTRLRVNGTLLPLSGAGQVLLDFDGNAVSPLQLNYADAGKLQLNASFQGSGEEQGLSLTGTSPEFVAAPHHLRVRATADGAPLNNTTSSGTPHWRAGEDFDVEVSGVCEDGSVTPNFAASTSLNATAANPAPGTFTGGPLNSGNFTGGRATGTASYSEVGTVTLEARAGNYLDSGIDVTGSTIVGRFTPDHFDVSLNSPTFETGCESGGFTYVGQPFVYTTVPEITVIARNKQGDTTGNYSGSWWKITSGNLIDKTYTAATGDLDDSGIPANDPVIADLGGGMGTLTFNAGGGLFFERNSPVDPFAADISLSINVADADGIAATANPVTFGAATAGNGIPFDNGKTMRWGRLVLQNAYGSELLQLPMPLRAEYYDDGAFVRNLDDGCTALALTQLTFDNGTTSVFGDQPVAVGTGSSNAALLSPMVSGDAGLTFSPPSDDGFIDVQVDLSALPWLRYNWDGIGGHDNDPTGRATFGIYRGRPSLIYRRETYR